MLSIDQCREKLGTLGETLTDQEIAKLRGELYELSNIALDHYIESKASPSIKD